MMCYTRHLKDIFDKAGVEFTKENMKRADKPFKKWFRRGQLLRNVERNKEETKRPNGKRGGN